MEVVKLEKNATEGSCRLVSGLNDERLKNKPSFMEMSPFEELDFQSYRHKHPNYSCFL